MIDEEYLDRLVRATPVRYYASGIDGARAFWPWRMNKAKAEADARHAAKCDHYIIDSNFKDESVTNRDVLDEAADLGADAAVLADVVHDMEATVGALLDGLDMLDDHHFDGAIVLPLQAPHAECYRRVAPSVDRDVWWAIGGLRRKNAAVKLDAARDLRSVTGTDEWIHGLGFGVTDELARTVRQNPTLLDSVDNSTAMGGSIPSLSGTKEKMTVSAAYATAERLRMLRALTPFAEEKSPEDIRESGQSGLEEIA